tara:strand:- start:47 stop:649 length:603 start_codon:yes stop_codon:yes gene_type:complete
MATKTIAQLKTGRDFVDVLDSALNLTDGGSVAGVTKLAGNTGLTAGSGFSDAALYKSWIDNTGGVTITNILIDLTGIRSTAANDIIGNDGAVNAHIGQYTVAKSGTIFAATIDCKEVPAGGDPDINLASANEATLAEDSALSAGASPVTIINSGDHTAGGSVFSTALPAANQYLYLVAGDATDADYTTGVLHIKLYGTTA